MSRFLASVQGRSPSKSRWRVIGMVALCSIGALSIGVAATIAADNPSTKTEERNAEDRPVIGIEYTGPIKVVYQVSSGESKQGFDEGLFYLDKLSKSYQKSGVDPERLDIRAVFHGSAAEHLLSNDAWNRYRDQSDGNPNAKLIAELVRNGVSIELCDTRRVANGWAKSDVHPDVLLVGGAYQRIIDLQLRGYAYIRF